MEKEKWTDNMKRWMDIDEVLLDERLYEDKGYLYFGTSQLKSNCFSITVPGTGPLHITKEDGIKLADAIYKSEGIDLRSEVTRLTAELDEIKKLAERAYKFYSPLDWVDPDNLEEADEILFALTQIYDPDPDISDIPSDLEEPF